MIVQETVKPADRHAISLALSMARIPDCPQHRLCRLTRLFVLGNLAYIFKSR